MTEILRRGPDGAVVDDEECSDEFDNCFESGRFSSEDTFLVQVVLGWLLVFPKLLPAVFWLRLLKSTIKEHGLQNAYKKLWQRQR